MFKNKGYKSLIALVILLNVFTLLAYPNEVYAIDDGQNIVNLSSANKTGKAVLLTQYLFENTPSVGEEIDLNAEYPVANAGIYTVVDYLEDENGLDAFILETPSGETILSIRGTEGKAFDGDVTVDAKLLLNENEQYEQLKKLLVKNEHVAEIDYVVGHSLGGSMALNTSLWLTDVGIDLKGVYIFASAPMIADEYLTEENIEKVNDILQLVVIDNEFLYNIGNVVAGSLKAVNPYDHFDYSLVSIDNDVNNSFANHYVSQFIPIIEGDQEANYTYYKVH